jgi:hypothetical protein
VDHAGLLPASMQQVNGPSRVSGTHTVEDGGVMSAEEPLGLLHIAHNAGCLQVPLPVEIVLSPGDYED